MYFERSELTSGVVLNKVAGGMELALEEFQTNDGIDDDQEYDQEKDVEQWNHCRDDRVEDDLQT